MFSSQVVQLRQLINKSKAVLLQLESDISAGKTDVRDRISKRYISLGGPSTLGGVLKPRILTLGHKESQGRRISALACRGEGTAAKHKRVQWLRQAYKGIICY